ncbi:UNVERIFIED_CONTAM: hypothetical protein NY603_17940, partial [Bacteroidetes bacterium 56_B9]
MINDDNADDETGELLKDPIAYAKHGQQTRRATNPAIPVSRFGSLSINSPNGNSNAIPSPVSNGYAPPRANGSISGGPGQMQMSNGHSNGANGTYVSNYP